MNRPDCRKLGGHDWQPTDRNDFTHACSRCPARCARDRAGKLLHYASTTLTSDNKE